MDSSARISSAVMPLEEIFLASAKPIKPRLTDGVASRFQFPAPAKPDETAAVKEIVEQKKRAYQDAINAEFAKFVNGDDCDLYLVLQPIWNANSKRLTGLEVLCRVANGKDDAPMPGLAVFQATQVEHAQRFLKKQCEFAVVACQQFPSITVSVNVRPDELASVKEFLIEKAQQTLVDGTSNLLIEITEYAPITIDTITLIREMKEQGVVFAIDDVTEVVDNPGKAMAKTGSHSCSFALAIEHADLFAVQKLALPMACSVFRVEVFPTPEYDGGKPQPFMKSMIFPEDQIAEIDLRRKLVEHWVAEVTKRNPSTRFVIESSVDTADVENPLLPQIPIMDGRFDIQGGLSGGRGFPLEAFLAVEPKLNDGVEAVKAPCVPRHLGA